MNILKKKGPRRLWIATSILWVLATIFIRNYHTDTCDPLIDEIWLWRNCVQSITNLWWFMAFSMPFMAFISFLIGGWIKSGFEQDLQK